jgi:Ca2+-binding EF-hand superfamily protein
MYNIYEVLENDTRLNLVAKKIFDAVDTDGSGKVSEDELHPILCSLSEDFGLERPTVTETEQILVLVDYDRSGVIDLREFTKLLRKVLEAVRDDDLMKLNKKKEEEEEENEF